MHADQSQNAARECIEKKITRICSKCYTNVSSFFFPNEKTLWWRFDQYINIHTNIYSSNMYIYKYIYKIIFSCQISWMLCSKTLDQDVTIAMSSKMATRIKHQVEHSPHSSWGKTKHQICRNRIVWRTWCTSSSVTDLHHTIKHIYGISSNWAKYHRRNRLTAIF